LKVLTPVSSLLLFLPINAVCPGPTVTPNFEQAMSPEAVEQLRATVPLGRPGQSEEITYISFLASNASRIYDRWFCRCKWLGFVRGYRKNYFCV
jgi:NAD(P)-dependent dehydrogenase (short-subunit alcohol dehydrogenase family)